MLKRNNFVSPVLVLVLFAILQCDREARAGFVMVGNYQFNGDLRDSMGNFSDMVAVGSGTFNAGSYSFAPNQGLQLVTSLTQADYRIEIDARFQDLTAWDKIIDFQNRTLDDGLYIDSSATNRLNFVGPAVFGSDGVSTGIDVTIGLQRVGQVVSVSLNGLEQFSFADPTGQAVTSAEKTLSFFIDDFDAPGDNVTGSVDAIRLFNVAAVPEPSSMLLIASAGAAAIYKMRRRRNVKSPAAK